MAKKVFLFLFVFGVSLLQILNISIFGIKPLFSFAVIIAAAFFATDFLEILILSFISVLMLKFSPGFQIEILIIFLLPIIIYFLKNILPWQIGLNFFISALGSLILFYAIVSPSLFRTVVFYKDLAIFLALSSVFYFVLSSWIGSPKSNPFRSLKKSL